MARPKKQAISNNDALVETITEVKNLAKDQSDVIKEKPQAKRPVRIPVSGPRDVLTVKGLDIETFEHRWVNDIDDRIQRFTTGGWEFTRDPDLTIGDPSVVNSGLSKNSCINKPVGMGITAYLMRIPKEFYDEDQQAKQDHLDELEETMVAEIKGNEYNRMRSAMGRPVTVDIGSKAPVIRHV